MGNKTDLTPERLSEIIEDADIKLTVNQLICLYDYSNSYKPLNKEAIDSVSAMIHNYNCELGTFQIMMLYDEFVLIAEKHAKNKDSAE